MKKGVHLHPQGSKAAPPELDRKIRDYFYSNQVHLINHLDESNVPDNFDAEGYYIWSLQKYVEEFILRQMVKHGLKVEIR